ncbi:MAG: DUF1778 domain-containing protein [Bacteroidota bacterium]
MARLFMRLTEEEKNFIKARAAAEGKTVTELILECTGVLNISDAKKETAQGSNNV